jgi:hypothetical protein
MRYTLLTTVAVATLALGGQVALAQTSQSPSSSSSQVKPPVSPSETSDRSETAPVQNRGSRTSSDQSEAQSSQNQRQGASSQGDSHSSPASSSSAQGQHPTTRAKEGSQDAARSSDGQQRSSQGSSQSATDTRTGSGSASRTDTDRQQRTRQEETSQSKTSEQPRSTTGANQQRENSTSSTATQPREGSTSSTAAQQRPNDTRQEAGTAQSSTSDQKSTSASTSGPSGSGALASLSSEQRSEVTQAFTSKSVNTVSNVNFDVSVGATVTRDVHLAPVPDEVVRILPQYRGYRYVVVRDEIVIVEPRTKRVVEVISKSGTPHRRSASLSLSAEQRRKLKSSVETTGSTRSSSTRIELRQGETLPQDVTLIEVPDTIVTEIPELRTYRYVVIGDEIAIVQPDTRRVIEIIE